MAAFHLAGSLLAAAIDESVRTGEPAEVCLRRVARDAGRGEARSFRARRDDNRSWITEELRQLGYEPRFVDDDEIELANCPFRRLAEDHRDVVCAMNLNFVDGILDGLALTDRPTAVSIPHPACAVFASPSADAPALVLENDRAPEEGVCAAT